MNNSTPSVDTQNCFRRLSIENEMHDEKNFDSNLPSIYRGNVIGPTSVMDLVTCPCCQQHPNNGTKIDDSPVDPYFNERSILSYSTDEDEEETASGVLPSGTSYQIRKCLVEGWVYKKGSGFDWLGSRAWKPRWARLSLAKIQGNEVDVPILSIYWHPYTTNPSTVLLLDSTVVIPVDLKDREQWNTFRFEIRHCGSTRSPNHSSTVRTFSCDHTSRDAWVYAISQALLDYEKSKASLRRRPWSPTRHIMEIRVPKSSVSLSPPSSPTSRRPLSPPNSPPLPKPSIRNTRRKEDLMGEPLA